LLSVSDRWIFPLRLSPYGPESAAS
jgi:hypothetical protein